ncbi:MAG: 2Fe-2S iron-sulfur cluster-binding protein, partial [Candidatus Binatia bacterium]
MKKPTNQKPRRKEQSIASPPARKHEAGYVWLNVLPDDLWLNIRQGETIYEALQKTDVELKGECGGLGKCGKCKVKVLSLTGPPTEAEKELLDEEELKQGIRLACRTKVNHDLVIYTGEPDAEAEYFQILTTSHILKTSHLAILCIDPLVDKRLVTWPPSLKDEGLSDLDRIKLAMGPEYQGLKAPLHCLRTLPEMLERTQFRGAAVLHENCLMAWQHWEELHRHYGLVFDLGTSTLVGKLISLIDGGEVAVSSCLNSQSKHGTNVIGRLQYVKEHPQGVETLHHLLIDDLNQITTRLLKTGGLNPNDIFVAVAAGNTAMQHLLL